MRVRRALCGAVVCVCFASFVSAQDAVKVDPKTGGQARFTFPDGKTRDVSNKAGDVQYEVATTPLPENTGDTAFDVIVIELKTTATKPHTVEEK